MTKFFTVAAFILLLMMLFLLATNNAGNPAVLSTVEYGINTDAAVADRAAERLHNEEMARIEAQELDVRLQWRTLMVFGGAGIVVVGLLAGVLIYGAASRPKVVLMLDGNERPVRVVDGEGKLLEVRR